MPIYEYQCRRCAERLETMQRLSDPPLTECPKCGGELKKLVSAPAFQFKGSGWYVTDYARKGEGADREAGEGRSGDKRAGDEGAAKPAGGEKADSASKPSTAAAADRSQSTTAGSGSSSSSSSSSSSGGGSGD